jgi:hypothetical protein
MTVIKMTAYTGKKKPPVFIGLGAVYNRNLNTLFREPGSPGLSKDWIKSFSSAYPSGLVAASGCKNPLKPLI